MIDNMITVAEMQEKLKISKNTAYKLVKVSGFPKIRIGRKIYIPEQELEKYLNSNLRSQIIL